MEWITIGIILGIVVLFFVFVRFTIVEEGTAKALTFFGEFSKIVFRWESHWMDTDWNIWRPGEEGSEGKKRSEVWDQKIFGGLIVYFWPFQKIHQYKHRWTDIRLEKDKMEVEYHEENLSHVLLRPAVYAFRLVNVETRPPERFPVTVLVLVTMRISNPYLFLFVAPPTPIEDILARISAETRALITSYELDNLLQLRGASFWEQLKGAKVIEESLEKWGLRLAEKGIEIRDIDLPPDYQEAAAARRIEQLKASGRAEEIMGTVISAVARAEGRNENLVQTEFQADPETFYRKHQRIIDNTMTKLAMEEGAYLRIETPGAKGALGDFLRLLGAWQRMPMGRPSRPSSPSVEKAPEVRETRIDRLRAEQGKKLEAKIKELEARRKKSWWKRWKSA